VSDSSTAGRDRAKVRVGVLYPSYGAEDDFARLARLVTPPTETVVVHTGGTDRHEPHIGREIGGSKYLLPGARKLALHNVDVCTWACTSGSFTFGLEGARGQVAKIAEYLDVPASSTSLAFANATLALGGRKVSVAATYPQEHAASFCAFLEEAGIQVVHLGAMGVWTGIEVGEVERPAVLEFVAANDHADADALLVPDTALHTVAFLDELEQTVGKPVLTANQVTCWDCLRLAGRLEKQEGLGTLFAHLPVADSITY